MKEERWYNITVDEGGRKVLNVYDRPFPEKATASSHTKIEDLPYYRRTFKLSQTWNEEE